MAEPIERRRSRSYFRGEAANLYLRSLSHRFGLRAAVLANEQGLPIAASGPQFAVDSLSAYGAFRAAATTSAPEVGPRSRAFSLGDHPVSLTILGNDELPWSVVTSDLKRILELGDAGQLGSNPTADPQ